MEPERKKTHGSDAFVRQSISHVLKSQNIIPRVLPTFSSLDSDVWRRQMLASTIQCQAGRQIVESMNLTSRCRSLQCTHQVRCQRCWPVAVGTRTRQVEHDSFTQLFSTDLEESNAEGARNCCVPNFLLSQMGHHFHGSERQAGAMAIANYSNICNSILLKLFCCYMNCISPLIFKQLYLYLVIVIFKKDHLLPILFQYFASVFMWVLQILFPEKPPMKLPQLITKNMLPSFL